MNEIYLPGLLARHPGAALATFGFYALLPGVRIYWKPHKLSYSPVLITDRVRNVDDLVEMICDEKTWEELLWEENPCIGQKPKISWNGYQSLDDEWTTLATDQELKELIVANTPFCFLIRQMSWKHLTDNFTQLLEPSQVKRILLNSPWKTDDYTDTSGKNGLKVTPYDQRNGLFYEVSIEKYNVGFAEKTMPSIVLLACLSYRLFPCFLREGKVTALGWDRRSFYYPIFNKPIEKESFVSWVVNKDLLMKMPTGAKKVIKLAAIYRSDRVDYKVSNNVESVLWQATEVK